LRPATMRDDGKLLKHSNCRLVDAAQPARVGFLTIPAQPVQTTDRPPCRKVRRAFLFVWGNTIWRQRFGSATKAPYRQIEDKQCRKGEA
jgi:hypothetical protein